MFPRIFSVECNCNRDPFLWRVVNNLAQPAQDIFGCHIGSGFMVDEAKRIGDLPVAEEYRDVLALRPDLVGLVQIPVAIPWLLRRTEGASEDPFVGRHPLQSDLR